MCFNGNMEKQERGRNAPLLLWVITSQKASGWGCDVVQAKYNSVNSEGERVAV